MSFEKDGIFSNKLLQIYFVKKRSNLYQIVAEM